MVSTQLRVRPPAFFWVVVLLVLAASPAFAQRVTGTITGTVMDEKDAVLPGTNITVVNTQTKEARQTVSDERGVYTVPSLPPGIYSIAVEVSGFKKAMRENIVLKVAEIARVDVVLQIGELSETVTVTEHAARVQSETASVVR